LHGGKEIMTKKDSFSAIDDFDIDESQNNRAIENGIYNAYERIRAEKRERELKEMVVNIVLTIIFSTMALFVIAYCIKQTKQKQVSLTTQTIWKEEARPQVNKIANRTVAECIKPGNIIDNDVNECVRGYRAKTW
jgi:hypothetical protein